MQSLELLARVIGISEFTELRRRDPEFCRVNEPAMPCVSTAIAIARECNAGDAFSSHEGLRDARSHPSCSTRHSVVKAFADSVREVKRTPADVPLSAAATAAHTCARFEAPLSGRRSRDAPRRAASTRLVSATSR